MVLNNEGRIFLSQLRERQDVFCGSRRSEPEPSNMCSCNARAAEDEHCDHNYARSYVLRCMNEKASGNSKETSEKCYNHYMDHKMTRNEVREADCHGDVSTCSDETNGEEDGSNAGEENRGGTNAASRHGIDNVNDGIGGLADRIGSSSVNKDCTKLAGMPGSGNVNNDLTSGRPGNRSVNNNGTHPAGTPGICNIKNGPAGVADDKDLLSSAKDKMVTSSHTNFQVVDPARAVLGYSGVGYRTTDPSLANTIMKHVKSAVQKVRSGEGGVDAVAREFGLPPSLLRDNLNGNYSYQVFAARCTVQAGLFDFEEQNIIQFLQYMDCCGFPISTKLVNSAVLSVIQRSGLLKRSKISSEKGPMERWCRSFLLKHCSNLMGRITSLEGKQRWQIAAKQTERYVHLLNFLIQEHGLEESPGQIYNCGELRLAGEIIVRNRLRSRYKQAPRIAAHSTQYMCVSASGRILLPFIVFPNASETTARESSSDNWVLETSADSTMNEELFRKWFTKVFLPHCSYETQNKPVLLIMDNGSSMLTPDVVELAMLNNVHFLYSPEQLKSKLQPLGYSVFDLLKQRIIDEIRRRHPLCEDIRACRCSHEDIPSVFETATSLISATDIQTAFYETGIYPFNYDFLSSLAPMDTSVNVYNVRHIVTLGTSHDSPANALLRPTQPATSPEKPAVCGTQVSMLNVTMTQLLEPFQSSDACYIVIAITWMEMGNRLDICYLSVSNKTVLMMFRCAVFHLIM